MFKDHDLRTTLYFTINNVAYYLIMLYFVIMVKRKRNILSGLALGYRKQLTDKAPKNLIFKALSNVTLLAFIENVIFFLTQYQFPGATNLIFADWFGTGTNYFGLLSTAPILSTLVCFMLWVNPLKQMDITTPIFPLALAITKISCFCAGCCNGAEWQHGVFNYRYGRPEVPVQLIEGLWGLLIFIFLMKYKKKAKTGTLYPIYLILFSATRFFSEFLRAEPNVLGPLKTYHLLCLAGIVYGVILYLVALKLGDKITALFEDTTYFTRGKLHGKVVVAREEIANTDFSIKNFINSIKSKPKKTKPVIK